MINLNKFIENLNVSESFKKLLLGNVYIPYIADGYEKVNEKEPVFFFPPMLIPLFVDYSLTKYKGLITHPLSNNRTSTFISYNIEDDNILEIARNENQFLTLMVLEMNMIIEGLDDKINSFCDEINYSFANEIDFYADKYGNDSIFFNKLIFLEDDLPLSYCKSIDQYKGDYPSSKDLINQKVVYSASSYEIHNNQLSFLKEQPSWFKTNVSLEKLFVNFLEAGEFESAWFTLNCRGWDIEKLAMSLEKLTIKVNNPTLNLISDNWLKNYSFFKS
ncbi:hypothetical protein [Aquimarina macrocephali]|uniref:hypothetical protein n=1 Tax=Aquimarina macrocephali TaxID=666563 RepID=UPI003F678B7B